MRNKMFGGALLALTLVFSTAGFMPQEVAEPVEGIFLITGILDCCKQGPILPYCCDNCCWILHDCVVNDDCL